MIGQQYLLIKTKMLRCWFSKKEFVNKQGLSSNRLIPPVWNRTDVRVYDQRCVKNKCVTIYPKKKKQVWCARGLRGRELVSRWTEDGPGVPTSTHQSVPSRFTATNIFNLTRVQKFLQNRNKVLFSSPQNSKKIQDFLSHRILRHMHEALNIDENKN